MRHYAQDTKVSPTSSVEQIRRLLTNAGSRGFAFEEVEEYAQIAFQLHDRTIRFKVQYPSPDDRQFTHTEVQGWEREPRKARELWERAIRQKWRALHLMVKAKLEAIASGIVTAEKEWMPYTVLRTGQTVSEWVEEQQTAHAMLEPGERLPNVIQLPPMR